MRHKTVSIQNYVDPKLAHLEFSSGYYQKLRDEAKRKSRKKFKKGK